MATGLLFDSDKAVAEWLFSSYGERRYSYDRCLGLLHDGTLCGAVLFHNWNGANVEISYYGQNALTPGIVRCLAIFILGAFDPSRLTSMVSKRNKHFIKGLMRLGFKLEGAQHCYYGKRDCTRNTGIRLVMFRETIEQLAGITEPMSA